LTSLAASRSADITVSNDAQGLASDFLYTALFPFHIVFRFQ
jgi:hypothetical protein